MWGGGIRTLTWDGLSALPLPVGLRPRGTILAEACSVRGALRISAGCDRGQQVPVGLAGVEQ